MLTINLQLAGGLSGAEPMLALCTFMTWSGTMLHHPPPRQRRNSTVTTTRVARGGITSHILNYGNGMTEVTTVIPRLTSDPDNEFFG